MGGDMHIGEHQLTPHEYALAAARAKIAFIEARATAYDIAQQSAHVSAANPHDIAAVEYALQAKRAAIFARASAHPYAAYMAVLGIAPDVYPE
ncbi:MAG: hypothetical protein RL076_1584 [Chloroflexota bacterium]